MKRKRDYMENKTHISRTITGNNNRDRYDAEVKKILGNKLVLAWIMKYSVGEFMDYAIDEIQETPDKTSYGYETLHNDRIKKWTIHWIAWLHCFL